MPAGKKDLLNFALLGETDHQARTAILLALNVDEKCNKVVSIYPEFDGMPVDVTLSEIHEWGNGAEATLEGTITMDEAEREIAFFDTRYALHKGEYTIGETYTFRLSACAYTAEILKERTFQFEGEAAAVQREKCGMEQEYDEQGNPSPLVFDLSGLLALLPKSQAYPHEAEFQSPIFAIEEMQAFSGNFYKAEIAIARDVMEGQEIRIPLFVKQSFFQTKPEINDPIRGILWLQGYAVELKSSADDDEWFSEK